MQLVELKYLMTLYRLMMQWKWEWEMLMNKLMIYITIY